MNASDKLKKARAGLVLDMPFFGALALRLAVVEDPACKTAWTNGRTLGFNPEFVNALSLSETKGLLAHEVMHCALSHQTRRGSRDAKRWNVAGDYAINAILDASRVTLPAGRLLDTIYDGMSAEAIYSHLPEPESSKAAGDTDGDGNDPGGCGEVRDASDADGKPASEAAMTREATDWKIATAQAAQTARAMGAMPAALDRLVKELVDAKIDWRETLRRFVQDTAKNNYQWSPPNRRYVHAGLYLPSLRSQELPPIVVAVDTSGSIGADILAQFAGEVNSILEEYQTTCEVLYCDTQIQGHQTFTRDDLPLVLQGLGGGGTDFRPPFTWVADNDMRPSCLVYLTDMQGRFPAEEPGYPVLWVNTGGEAQAPFGEMVKI